MLLTQAAMDLYDRITDRNLLVRRITINANHLIPEQDLEKAPPMQLNLFEEPEDETYLQRERKRQETVLQIRQKFGKNAILKGMNLEEGATARDRNSQIGGHKA